MARHVRCCTAGQAGSHASFEAAASVLGSAQAEQLQQLAGALQPSSRCATSADSGVSSGAAAAAASLLGPEQVAALGHISAGFGLHAGDGSSSAAAVPLPAAERPQLHGSGLAAGGDCTASSAEHLQIAGRPQLDGKGGLAGAGSSAEPSPAAGAPQLDGNGAAANGSSAAEPLSAAGRPQLASSGQGGQGSGHTSPGGAL